MDDPRRTAQDLSAPQDERSDAISELAEIHKPTGFELIPREDFQPVIDLIKAQTAEQAIMRRAGLQKAQVVNYPRRGYLAGKRKGMTSLYIDDMQVAAQGDYYDRPGALSFAAMRNMVDKTPVLSAAILTRIRQVQRFCHPAGDTGPGFRIRHIDPDHELSDDEERSIDYLTKFLRNSGWEWNPRRRKRLRRDSFPGLMGKLTRDSLTMDSAPIETEMRRDRKGIDGLYAVDGETIRLCTEEGYEGKDDVFALQVVQGRIVTAYTIEDLIYEPRNPRSDVLLAGYGLGEVELMVRLVTGFLNAMSYNIAGFDNNSIPKGMLHLSGNYSEADINSFKRWWNAMVKGVSNAWSLPVMVSAEQESKAAFERFGVDFDEMMFSKWMTFLVSIICAIFGMSPDEINFESFSASRSALSGSDTTEKLADSKDKGLRPLLAYFEGLINEYVISTFGEKFVFEWSGLDEEDEQQRFEMRKSIVTVNEARQQENYGPLDGPLGGAPLNPSLIGPWMQLQQGGQPGAEGLPPEQGGDFGTMPADSQAQGGGAGPSPGQQEAMQQQGDEQDQGSQDFGQSSKPGDFGKSLPTIYAIG